MPLWKHLWKSKWTEKQLCYGCEVWKPAISPVKRDYARVSCPLSGQFPAGSQDHISWFQCLQHFPYCLRALTRDCQCLRRLSCSGDFALLLVRVQKLQLSWSQLLAFLPCGALSLTPLPRCSAGAWWRGNCCFGEVYAVLWFFCLILSLLLSPKSGGKGWLFWLCLWLGT